MHREFEIGEAWISDLPVPSVGRLQRDNRAKPGIVESMCPSSSIKDNEQEGREDCTGDSEVSTMTSPVFYDIIEHTWSLATSEKQEKRQKQRRNTKSSELALHMFTVLYKH